MMAEARIMLCPRRSSFGSKKRGVSELVGVLLMVAITVAAAVIILSYVTGLFASLNKGGTSTHVSAAGSMIVPGTFDSSSIMSLTLTNGASTPVQNIAVSCPTSYFNPADCGGLKFSYKGNLVSAGTPLAPGSTATVSGAVSACNPGPGCLASQFTSGTSYVITLTVTFNNGSSQIVLVSVPSTS
jgi:flagellin-like protein